MSYYKTLFAASKWLSAIQNPNDFGWGLNSGQASSIVNTAEALYVLKRSNQNIDSIKKGLGFIKNNLYKHLEERGVRTRYVQFCLFSLLDNYSDENKELIDSCIEWLLEAKNLDGGWGHQSKDGNSMLYPTCFSLLLLKRRNLDMDLFITSYNWLISKKINGLWKFHENSDPSEIASAMSILALKTHYNKIYKTEEAENFISKYSLWGTEIENIPGTKWEHCSYMWIFPALLSIGQSPNTVEIIKGINKIVKQKSEFGWTEPDGAKTIRGDFWVVYAMDSIISQFDPEMHLNNLIEPNWVHIFANKRWEIIIPKKIYKYIIYTFSLFSIICFLRLNRFYAYLPDLFDLGLSIMFFVLVYNFVKLKPDIFPKHIKKIILSFLALLVIIQLILGYTLKDIFFMSKLF